MHRVFTSLTAPGDPRPAEIDDLRLFLRGLGLSEREVGRSFVYTVARSGGAPRHFATLTGSMRTATIYLYPDALGREPGYMAAYYRRLDAAGLGMGSKAGPSIGINLDDPEQLRLFCEGLENLVGPRARPGHLPKESLGVADVILESERQPASPSTTGPHGNG